jgi:two-component system response regulator MprA
MHHPAARPNASIHESPRARLLVVDDEQLIRELYGRVLSLEGYEVETAEDGVTALEWLAREHFDLVLTDWQMPRLDGASMLLALRSAGSHTPVIMMSGSLPFTPPPAGVASHLSAILQKPVRYAEVIFAVAAALRPAPPRIQKQAILNAFRSADFAAA